MGKNERQAYLKAIRLRYRRADKKVKAAILDEFCAVCDYHRKYAIRLLNRCGRPTKPGQPGCKPVYPSKELLIPLKRLWFATDQMCSKKLKAAIPLWLPFYESAYEVLAPEIRDKLLTISAATIDRVLKPIRVKHGRKGLGGTKPGSLLNNQIPIRTHNWDITQPGFMEADTVAHCGNSLAGDFIWSRTMTDIHTTWTENRATWRKGATGVLEQIKGIEAILPFTRTRPYKKNDNAHVEQKNWTHVRQLFSYDRLEDKSLLSLMNDLYSHEWSHYQNHFCPSMKLLERKRINSKYHKKYDHPKTPYQRVLESEQVNQATKDQLESLHRSLNPFILKQTIEKKLRVIFKQVKVTSNVRQRI